ncbi:MAG: rod shape-determining protein MreD [Clostridium sp.]
MKKILINLAILLSVYIITLLEVIFFKQISILSIVPNFLIIVMIFLIDYLDRFTYMSMLVLIGIYIDIVFSMNIGFTSASLLICAFIDEIIDNILYQDNRVIYIIRILILTFIFNISYYMLRVVLYNLDIQFIQLLIQTTTVAILNILLGIVIYRPLKYVGLKIEKFYKKSNILTRYF